MERQQGLADRGRRDEASNDEPVAEAAASPVDAEKGVILPLVALMMGVLISASALVIDVSNGRRVTEELVTATDAAALAAAHDYATENPGAACTTAAEFLADNDSTAVLDACSGIANPVAGNVAVTATVNADTFLASIVGIDDFNVTASSVAGWGPPAAVGMFRPLSFCLKASDTLTGVSIEDVLEDDEDATLTIAWDKNDPDDCGDTSPGNWGEVHLDDSFGHSESNMISWLSSGYDELIRLGGEGSGTCPGPAACVRGSFNNWWDTSAVRAVLNSLESSGEYFLVPIYDHAVLTSSGGGADFHVIGVMRGRLENYDASPPSSTWFFQMTFDPYLITGACCGDPETSSGNRVLALCGLDPAELGACP